MQAMSASVQSGWVKETGSWYVNEVKHDSVHHEKLCIGASSLVVHKKQIK